MTNKGKPILLTGAPRSGTTWVGRVLATSLQVGFINEIFNWSFYNNVVVDENSVPFKTRYLYITEDNANQYEAFIRDALSFKFDYSVRKARTLVQWQQRYYQLTYHLFKWPRPLLKDPIAILSSQWIAQYFDADVIILIRHPAAFVASLDRLNWHFDISQLFTQPALVEDYLHPYYDLLHKGLPDNLENRAWMWRILNEIVLDFYKENSSWILKRHEDLSNNPLVEFQSIFTQLGIAFSPQVKQYIQKTTSDSNPVIAPDNAAHHLKRNSQTLAKDWKNKITPEDSARIREIVEPVSSRFYSDDDW